MNSHISTAEYLLTLWNRLSSQHIPLGCSCLMSGVSLKLDDFEIDIADYLWAESERTGEKDVVKFLLIPGPISIQTHPIKNILKRINNFESTEKVSNWLLIRLTKTIRSYVELHGFTYEAPLLGGSKKWGGGYRE